MDDTIALDRALASHDGNIPAALARFKAERRPIVEKLVQAANASAEWYERVAEHRRLAPIEFVMSYVMRSGRVDLKRLRTISPALVAGYESAR